jgi:hypothetical protein
MLGVTATSFEVKSMELCAVLLSWVFHLSDYERTEGCPSMRHVPHEWLEQQACSGRKCRVLGWYPGEGNVVYLDAQMDVENNLLHTSIALHEIAHWVQGESGALLSDCESSLRAEREAYHIQREFLKAYGTYQPVGTVLPMIRCERSDSSSIVAAAQGDSAPVAAVPQ